MESILTDGDWRNLGTLPELQTSGRYQLRLDGKQIVLFRTEEGVFAVNNHCPHQGYPLSEGALGEDCRLTCNWHSWTFDLRTGEALIGEDPVRSWPVREQDGNVWIDLSPETAASRLERARRDVREAIASLDYERIARGIARHRAAGGSDTELIAGAISATAERLDEGMGHAHAGAADWLALPSRLASLGRPLEGAETLVPALESLGHLAYDAAVNPDATFPAGCRPWDEKGFLSAMESREEANAIAYLRGAINAGAPYPFLADCLAKTALSHYLGFGHGLIYVAKSRELVARLGPDSAMPVSILLARYQIRAGREDLTPQFRSLASATQNWRTGDATPPDPYGLIGKSVRQLLDMLPKLEAQPEALLQSLAGAAGLALLRFKADMEHEIEVPVSRSVGWLDFTHAITFADALRKEAALQPELWPAGLAQLACFIGRNAAFLSPGAAESVIAKWRVDSRTPFLRMEMSRLINHEDASWIHAVHRLKTACAVQDLTTCFGEAEESSLLLAALNRLLNSPWRHKAPARTAYQAASLVALEG